jgi:hypothetical protein
LFADGGTEALAKGATKEALALVTALLGGRAVVGSSSADKGVDSFIDSGFS